MFSWIVGPAEHASLWSVPDIPLGILHFLSNFVTQDFIPVDLGACDRKLATQSLEGGVRHGLVVLADGRLRERSVDRGV